MVDEENKKSKKKKSNEIKSVETAKKEYFIPLNTYGFVASAFWLCSKEKTSAYKSTLSTVVLIMEFNM